VFNIDIRPYLYLFDYQIWTTTNPPFRNVFNIDIRPYLYLFDYQIWITIQERV